MGEVVDFEVRRALRRVDDILDGPRKPLIVPSPEARAAQLRAEGMREDLIKAYLACRESERTAECGRLGLLKSGA